MGRWWKRAELVPEPTVEPVTEVHPARDAVEPLLVGVRAFAVGDEKVLHGWLRHDTPAERRRLASTLEPLDVTHFFERVDGGTRVTVTHPRPPRIPPEWRWNLAGFLLTIVSTLWAGAYLEGAGWDFFVREPNRFADGIPFSATLMAILAAHELGHYVAARRYGLHVTLPFFIPMPILSPIGTLGAVIRMKTPIYTRRMLLDVGAAGPVAGMVVAVPVAAWGILRSTIGPAEGGAISLGEPLLFQALVGALTSYQPGSQDLYLDAVGFAGWIGFLVTALNMLPVGQLDGGHVLYALVGRIQHRIALVFLAAMLVLGWWWPGWYVWSALLVLVVRIKHPPVLDPEIELDPARKAIGWLAVALFGLTFTPIPFAL